MPSSKVEAKLEKLVKVFDDVTDKDFAKILEKAAARAKERGLPYATLEKAILK